MKSKLFIAIATVGLILGNANMIQADTININPILMQNDQEVVKFDPVLEKAIRAKLAVSENTPLTKQLLLKITELKIDNVKTDKDGNIVNWDNDNEEPKISSLKGIEKLANLSTLSLINHDISDIKPLSSLSHLTYLDLRGNRITDIKPLSNLSKLTYVDLMKNLDLSENQITDIEPLSSLSNLTSLDLRGNQIIDIKPLSSLSNLTYLDLESNQITDIKPLSSLSNLTTLDLGGNPITNCEVLPEKLRWSCPSNK